MQKTILYHLFRIGAIPKKLRPVLEEEEILVCDERISGWLIMKDFKAPGKRFKHRMEGLSGHSGKEILSYKRCYPDDPDKSDV